MNILKRWRSTPNKYMKLNAIEIEKLLDKEISKKNPNFKYINKLSEILIEAQSGGVPEIDVDEAYEKFKVISKQRKAVRVPKWVCGVAACITVLFCGNIYTVSAYDMNVFSFTVEYMEGGVKIGFNQETEIVLPTSEDDPYGIIAVLAENGIENVETPHYIPDGFILTLVDTENIPDYCNYAGFVYKKGKQLISLHFEKFANEEDAYNFCIPSDEHNISEIDINGHPAVMSREDDQMIMAFCCDSTYFSMFTGNVDYIECDKILKSFTIS